jgi:three-Cys-motif partner protein
MTIRFRAIYVEEHPQNFKRLSSFLDRTPRDGIQCHPLKGDYFAQQDEILRLCGSSFAFFFIDPTGWSDVALSRLARLLKRPNSEFLINFMYDFINRAIGIQSQRSNVEAVIGPLSNDEIQLLQLETTERRGEWIVRRYREQLKRLMDVDGLPKAYSYHAEILNKNRERLHYHLVYLTRHPKGILKFAESSQKTDFLQFLVRIQVRKDADIQGGLFSAEAEAAVGYESKIGIEQVQRYWLESLSFSPRRCGEAMIASMLENTGWRLEDFERALASLIAMGRVRNLDAPGKRTKHPVHFEKNERLVLEAL